MQPYPPGQTPPALRAEKSQSAFPTANLAKTPTSAALARRLSPQSKRGFSPRRAFFSLTLCGLCLALCYWLLYPLSAVILRGPVKGESLLAAFPWLADLYWTNRLPFLLTALSHLSWLNLLSGTETATAHCFLVLLGLAFVLLFLAGRVCQRVARASLRREQVRPLVLPLCFFTLLFGVLMLFLPASPSQDILLSGLYGRLILFYHVNPYLAAAGPLTHDPLYQALASGSFMAPQTGPLWLDLTVPAAWLTRDNPALTLFGFRLAGLLFHLANAGLIWAILAKLKPEVRLGGTLLYAWNPAILLLGVGELPALMAVIFLVLLATLFFQRASLLASWICLLLAVLINPLCLLLLPLFFGVLKKEVRTLRRFQRVFWWLSLLVFSALLVVLAYAPYWRGLGFQGIGTRLADVFWPQTAQYSLLSAFEQLPFASWPPAAWLLTPQHWIILPALAVGILLLIGTWLVDSADLLLLFGSWVFLGLAILFPISSPGPILLGVAFSQARLSRRTSLLVHLLTLGLIVTFYFTILAQQWSGQALVTIGLPMLIWGWALFVVSTWQMTHRADEHAPAPVQTPRRSGLSRPSWPSRRPR